MSDPLVSIITPCYNAEAFLDRYFNSILNQTYKHIELVLINDGSTDNTEKYVKKYISVLQHSGVSVVYKYQQNQGQAAALNRGLKLFTGEYLTWIDVDDEMTNNCIKTKVRFLESHKDVDYCVCSSAVVNEQDTDKVIEILSPRGDATNRELFEGLIFNKDAYYVCGGYMVRTSFLDLIIKSRDIFIGRGGQNAQMLLPIVWYGTRGIIDEVLYKIVVREKSHSHSALSNPNSTIKQLQLFESILINTINRMDADEVKKYITEIQKHYARFRFGHALDTKNKNTILKSKAELEKLKIFGIKERYLVCRYTNKLLNIIKPVK